MDAAVEVAVARQYGSGVQIAVYDFLLDFRVERAAHAVAGSAGEGDDAEAEFFHFGQQTCFFQIDFRHFRAGGERGFNPRFAFQPEAVGVARQKCGGNDVARVGSVGATGNRGDDDRAVGHEAV